MCVGSVCTHPSYNDKNPPSVFFKIPILKSPFSNQAVLRFLSEWRSFAQAPPTIVDWQDCLTLDPPWVNWELSASGAGKTRCLKLSDWGVLLLDVIMNIAVVIYSWHLSRWRCRGLTLHSPIYINASMFARIICDPTSSTDEVSIRVFYVSLQIAFPNNVLVSQFRGWSLQSARHPTEERGGQQSHEHLKQHGL